MMPLYDRESLDSAHIPSHFKSEIYDLFVIAVAVGWKLHVTSDQGCTLISPKEEKKYHFGRRVQPALKRVRRDIFRFGDPRLVALADATVDGTVKAKDAASLLKHMDDVGSVVLNRPQDEEKQRAQEQPRQQGSAGPTPADMPKKKAEPAEVPSESERHIVSESPMLAKSSEGQAYESKAAIERRWSDGSIDYQCTQCSYTSQKRLSIRGHFQVHTKKDGNTGRQRTFKAEVPLAVHYKPRQARIDALAQHLQACLDDGRTDVGEIAREALTWVHEQSSKGTPLAGEREELQPEDILNRIRNLLDDGSYARQVDELARLRAQLAAAEQRAEAAEQRAQQARSTLKAFTDMANEFVSEGQEETA